LSHVATIVFRALHVLISFQLCTAEEPKDQPTDEEPIPIPVLPTREQLVTAIEADHSYTPVVIN
jgi:hypothetical protein